MRYLFYVLLCFFSVINLAHGDSLYLNDGRILKGRVYKKGNIYYIKMKYGTLSFSHSQVVRVVRNSTPPPVKTTKNPVKKKPSLLKKSGRLLSYGLIIKEIPSGWTFNNNPPHPLQAAVFTRGSQLFAITATRDAIFSDIKADSSASNIRRVLIPKLSQRYRRISKLTTQWTTFGKYKALYVQASVQPFFTRKTFSLLQELHCFTSKREYNFYMEATLGSRYAKTSELKSDFQRLLSSIEFLPDHSYKNEQYRDYNRGFEIFIPSRWTAKSGKAPLLILDGLEGERVILEKRESPQGGSLAYFRGVARDYLAGQFPNFISGAFRKTERGYFYPGKIWRANLLLNIGCHIYLDKKVFYYLITLYPPSLKEAGKKRVNKIVSSFHPFAITDFQKQMREYKPAFYAYLEARAFYIGRKYPQAIVALEKSLKIFPRYFDALLLKMQVHLAQKEDGLALEAMEKAHKLNKTHPLIQQFYRDSIYKKAVGFLKEKKLQQALFLIKKALNAYPKDKNFLRKLEDCHYQIAYDLYLREKDSQCGKYIEKMGKKHRGSRAWRTSTVRIFSLIINRNVRAQKFRKAERYARKVYKMYPGFRSAKNVIVRFYMLYASHLLNREKNKSRAASYAKKVLRIDPRNGQARSLLKQAQKK